MLWVHRGRRLRQRGVKEKIPLRVAPVCG
jgi:hypothetical protein